jgi:hypothetical protein
MQKGKAAQIQKLFKTPRHRIQSLLEHHFLTNVALQRFVARFFDMPSETCILKYPEPNLQQV